MALFLAWAATQKFGKETMRELEIDAVPRPTTELLDKAVDSFTKGQISLQLASYQETKNNRIENGIELAAQFETIRQAVNKVKEIRGKL